MPRSLIFKGGGLKDPERDIEVGTEFVDRTYGPTRLFEQLVRVLASQERSRTIDQLQESFQS